MVDELFGNLKVKTSEEMSKEAEEAPGAGSQNLSSNDGQESVAQTSGGDVVVKSGANSQTVTLNAGEEITVRGIRDNFGLSLSIAPTAIAVIGGEEVDDDEILAPGDTLEFVKRSGSKG